MKATEFVKKYGWERAKREISYKGTMMQCNNADGILEDLQNLVNAYELVEKYRSTYGESARWFFIAEYCKDHCLAPHQSDVYSFVAAKYDSYVDAVESCT